MNKSINNLVDLLSDIKKKPCLYLENKKSLSELYYLMSGFAIAYVYEEYQRYPGIIPGFDTWIHQKYNDNSVRSWKDVLLLNSNTEEQAFDLFFEELEAFLKENDIKIPKVK